MFESTQNCCFSPENDSHVQIHHEKACRSEHGCLSPSPDLLSCAKWVRPIHKPCMVACRGAAVVVCSIAGPLFCLRKEAYNRVKCLCYWLPPLHESAHLHSPGNGAGWALWVEVLSFCFMLSSCSINVIECVEGQHSAPEEFCSFASDSARRLHSQDWACGRVCLKAWLWAWFLPYWNQTWNYCHCTWIWFQEQALSRFGVSDILSSKARVRVTRWWNWKHNS